ncbi:MAG: 30S ribosomal protein S2 [archaeon]|jgi:small subunit ribosomal protein S2|nr:30S ribosomal protein S2 [Euryarchaeota archaeon]MDP6704199.1 30S ribosomal protein S2 [archaeon]|tara:strand:- start:19767 stop:20402 length:636 start_codon:yes stop_codon:yes gene_type:complete
MKDEIQTIPDGNLVSLDKYLAAGVHIGTQRKMKDMLLYIYKIRPDGLSILDIGLIDKKLGEASDYIAKHPSAKVVVVCARDAGKKAADKFAEVTGANSYTTRYMPGTFTNPEYKGFREPALLIAVDPAGDKQAITEACSNNVPVLALCDTNNMTQNIDFVLPVNNKGKKSLALVFWVLAREVLLKRGKLKSADDFKVPLEEFEDISEVQPQ